MVFASSMIATSAALESGVALAATLAALLLALLGLRARARRLPLPPGPTSPWLGLGRPDISRAAPWRTYTAWRQVYGAHPRPV